MAPNKSVLRFKVYSPSKRRFKTIKDSDSRVRRADASCNIIPNVSEVSDDGQCSDRNGDIGKLSDDGKYSDRNADTSHIITNASETSDDGIYSDWNGIFDDDGVNPPNSLIEPIPNDRPTSDTPFTSFVPQSQHSIGPQHDESNERADNLTSLDDILRQADWQILDAETRKEKIKCRDKLMEKLDVLMRATNSEDDWDTYYRLSQLRQKYMFMFMEEDYKWNEFEETMSTLEPRFKEAQTKEEKLAIREETLQALDGLIETTTSIEMGEILFDFKEKYQNADLEELPLSRPPNPFQDRDVGESHNSPLITKPSGISLNVRAVSAPPRLQLDDEETSKPRQHGHKVNSNFLTSPNGELEHPSIDWIIDKVSMDSYMNNYAKQEGFAVNPVKERGDVIRWRCIHAGKYNNHRNLPAEVTSKDQRREAAEMGTNSDIDMTWS